MSEETRSKLIGICVAILSVVAIMGLILWASPTASEIDSQTGDFEDVLVSPDDSTMKSFESPEDVPLYDVLQVGDVVYTSRDLVNRTNYLLTRAGLNMPYLGNGYIEYKAKVLNYWASELSLPLYAEKNGIVVSDDEFKLAKDTLISNYGSEEAFKEALVKLGETEETFDETLKLNLLSTKILEVANIDTTVSDSEIQAYYEKNIDVMVTPAHCELYLIQCNSDEELETAKKRLDDGEDWDTVASELNILKDEGSGITNGFMGVLNWDELDTPVTEAIKNAGWGKHSDIIELVDTAGTIKVIVKGDNFVESHKILLEDAKEDIRQLLSDEKLSENFQTYMSGYFEELGIKILVDEATIAKNEANTKE